MWIINFALIFQIFVLINPLSSFPVLISAYENRMNIKKIAFSAVGIAFMIAITIAFIGPYLFQIFNITVDSFRIAGGIILMLLGIDRIRAVHEKKKVDKTEGIISIIATPLLVGPATISFLMIKTYDIGRFIMLPNILAAFLLVAVVFLIFSLSITKINEKIVNISSRVLGLFLTAIAIEMIARGIHNLLLI